MIDFHTHLLPGIDDGADDVYMAYDMLLRSKEQGVEIVVATPHFHPGRDTVDKFLKRRQHAYNELLSYIQDKNVKVPQIKLGAEIALMPEIKGITDLKRLCIEGTNTILLELPFTPWNDWIYYYLFELTAKQQLNIVVAHLERYVTGNSNIKRLQPIFDLDVAVQVNCDSVLDFRKRKLMDLFFQENRVEVIGSDMHNTINRITHMKEARARIEKKYGKDAWNLIMESTQKLLEQD